MTWPALYLSKRKNVDFGNIVYDNKLTVDIKSSEIGIVATDKSRLTKKYLGFFNLEFIFSLAFQIRCDTPWSKVLHGNLIVTPEVYELSAFMEFPNIQYCDHNSSPIVHVQTQMNLVFTLPLQTTFNSSISHCLMCIILFHFALL